MTTFGKIFRTARNQNVPSNDSVPPDFPRFWDNLRQGRETDAFIVVNSDSPAVLPEQNYADMQYRAPIPESNLFGENKKTNTAQMEIEIEERRRIKSSKNAWFLGGLALIVILRIVRITIDASAPKNHLFLEDLILLFSSISISICAVFDVLFSPNRLLSGRGALYCISA